MSGLSRTPGKRVYGASRTEGSNPSLSANRRNAPCGAFPFQTQELEMAKTVSRKVAASKQDTAMLRLQQKIAALQAENTELKIELEQYIEKWETLDGDAVDALIYLSRHKTAVPKEVAKKNGVNIQIAELYLRFLAEHHYARAPAAAGKPYTILHKGMRYLEERNLLG